MRDKPDDSLVQSPETTTGDLNVVADATAIYEGGRLTSLKISQLVDNEVALRQLVNNFNLTVREKEQLAIALQEAKNQLASYALQPALSVILAVVNLFGAILIGLATNYLSGDRPPAASLLLLVMGGLLTLIGAIGHIVVAVIIKQVRGTA